ncbi:MAG: TIR domain-containing protein [Alphaproteobacteria bacterium]|nr:TIR domain-containing protein [Alphaproteobacteria bacterium]
MSSGAGRDGAGSTEVSDATSFDVFISYSHKDKISADAVCAGLEGSSVRCWIAPRDIDAGSEWAEGIIHGLNRCRIMVLIFSANANQSHQVRREVERAVSREMPILPFRIENVTPGSKLEYFLSNLHWLDALTPPLAAHIERLAGTIKGLLSSPPGDHVASPSLKPVHAVDVNKVWRESKWLLGAGVALIVLAAGLFVWWFNQPTLSNHDQTVVTLAETVRNDINTGDLADADKTLASLLSLAPSNGHTYYFEGELQRVQGLHRDIYKAIDWFVRYMDDPRSQQVLASNRLDEKVCYETGDGFCRQRTAWIGHLLANMFYRLSMDASTDAEKRKTFLQRAEKYLHISLKFYPTGFEATVASPTQLVDNAWSSRQLTTLIADRLHKQ